MVLKRSSRASGNTRYLVFTFQFISVIVLALSIWLDVYPDQDKNLIAKYSTTIIGIITSLNLYAVSLFLNFAERRHEEFVQFTDDWHTEFVKHSTNLTSFIRSQDRVEVIDERDFFIRLKDGITKADKELLITYLSSNPPNLTSLVEKAQYFDHLQLVISQRPDLKIMRIVRATLTTADWIKNMVTDFNGRYHMSLAYVEYEENGFVSPISVQIIDRQVIFLLNLGEDKFNDRRIHLSSGNAAELFVLYYHGLWNGARVLIDEGKLNEENWQSFCERYDKPSINKNH